MEKNYFKLIFVVSMVLSVMGIFTEIFDYFNFKNYQPSIFNRVIQYFLWIFRVIYLYIGFERSPLNVYNLMFYILLFFGSIFFYISKGKELRLIRFFYSVSVISNIFLFLRLILENTVFKKEFKIDAEYQTEIYIYKVIAFLLTMFYIFLGYKMLKIIAPGTELDTFKKQNSDIINVTETPKIDRFIHLFFDTIIMFFLIFGIFELMVSYYRYQTNRIPDWLINRFVITIFFLIIRFTYYTFFERIFGATPGKFLTNSRVITLKSEILDTVNIFERTFYRHIPFEAFSFFGKKGWHDSFSETYVVKEKSSNVKSSYIIWTFILCLAILCFYLYEIFIDKS